MAARLAEQMVDYSADYLVALTAESSAANSAEWKADPSARQKVVRKAVSTAVHSADYWAGQRVESMAVC